MNKEIKEKWVAALRSGIYKQGRDLMKYIDSSGKIRFCCLGVLREECLLPLKGGDDSSARRLTYLELEAVDLNDQEQQELASMNDEGQSFTDIAEFIEKHH